MVNCDYKRIKPTKLCTADLVHLVDIQTRTLNTSGLESAQPVETFTTIRQLWCALETITGVRQGATKFKGVNIVDGSTHILWTPWDSELPDIENRNYWVLHNDIRYLILRVSNINERNTTVAIQLKERGSDDLEANKA